MEDLPKMTVADWLDDLCVRFIINLPEQDLTSVPRICFQIEEAHWFYEDFIRPLDPQLPTMMLRVFCLKMFQHCPLLASFSQENHMQAFDQFLLYKTRIPVRGAIMLNQEMDACVLVKGWKRGSGWGFPRGKINKDEDDLECAIREVDEETGFDIRQAGLVPTSPKDIKYIEVPLRDQSIRLYVFRGVPEDTPFYPRTRKEISKIDWWKLSDLPTFKKKNHNSHNNQNHHNQNHHNNNYNNQNNNQPQNEGENQPAAETSNNKFYMVAPFLGEVRKWVNQQKKRDAMAATTVPAKPSTVGLHEHFVASALPAAVIEEPVTDNQSWAQPAAQSTAQPITGSDVKASLDDTTRELQRKWNAQPHVSAAPTPAPSSTTDRQDKGASLLALLQKGPSTAPSIAPTDFAQATANAAASHFTKLQPENSYQPTLAHPQPLPPQARSLLVGANATAAAQPARRRVSGDQSRVHLVPHPIQGGENVEKKYVNPRQHPQFLQATAMPSPPQALSHLYRDHHLNGPSVYSDKHRSALLDMFTKKADSAPPAQGSPRVSGGVPQAPPPQTGEDIHRGLLSLLPRSDAAASGLRPQTMSPGHNGAPYNNNQGYQTDPRLAFVVAGGRPMASPMFSSIYGANPAAVMNPPDASSFPAPAASALYQHGPPQGLAQHPQGPLQHTQGPPQHSQGPQHAQQHVPQHGLSGGPPQHSTAHKQHLLSLFGAGGSPAQHHVTPHTGTASPRPMASNGGEPISSADRNFLLGYLESATNAKRG